MEHILEKETQYKISEMSKFIDVEAHVLRYWEEELQLPIKRNELGHRYYTEEDRELFMKVKSWKEKGIQLKGIRSMLNLGKVEEEMPIRIQASEVMSLKSNVPEVTANKLDFSEDKEEKSFRLQLLLKNLIQEAVEESNEKLVDDIKECLAKELDYQFRVASEEQEQYRQEYTKQQEEYFRKLDEMIQSNRHTRNKKGIRLFTKKAK